MILEILGSRLIIPFFGNTIFVWSSLIIVTLAALSLGYWLGGKIADRYKSVQLFYFILLLAGLAVNILPRFKSAVLNFGDKFGVQFGPLVSAFLLFFTPLFLLGNISPFAIRLVSKSIEKTGRTSGNIFAFSTVGSLIGALLAGFFLIQFSVVTAIQLLSVLLMILGALGIFLYRPQINNKAVFFSLIIIGLLAMPFNHVQKSFSKIFVESEKETFYGNVKLIRLKESWSRCLLLDNYIQNCIDYLDHDILPFTKKMADIAMLNKDLRDILIMGFGLGLVLRNLDPMIKESSVIDIVDVNRDVVNTAFQAGFNKKQNFNFFIDDARRFLRKTDKKYDAIFLDVFGGSFLPPPHLFSFDAFAAMKKLLKPEGMLIVNTLGTINDDPLIESIAFTLGRVFPHSFYTKANNTGQSETALGNIIFIGFNSENSRSDYKSLEPISRIIDKIKLPLLLTDDRNPIEILAPHNYQVEHELTKKFLGGDFLSN